MYVIKVDDVILEIVKGDITEEEVDAIVNPANSMMIMGGGVAGAIKRKGGDIIEKEALSKAPVPVGLAISTSAGKLKAKYVIHAPTMERPAMSIDVSNVYKASRAAFIEAERLGITSISLPGMGTGVGGVSYRDAVKSMYKALKDLINEGLISNLKRVRFVAWGDEAYNEFLKAIKEAKD